MQFLLLIIFLLIGNTVLAMHEERAGSFYYGKDGNVDLAQQRLTARIPRLNKKQRLWRTVKKVPGAMKRGLIAVKNKCRRRKFREIQ